MEENKGKKRRYAVRTSHNCLWRKKNIDMSEHEVCRAEINNSRVLIDLDMVPCDDTKASPCLPSRYLWIITISEYSATNLAFLPRRMGLR